MKKSYQVLKWTAEVREKELQCLEEVELLDNHADGYTECYTFNSREEAESFIELFKPFYKNKTVMIQEANVFTSYIMNDYIIKEGEE